MEKNILKTDKRKDNGGARPGSGPKRKDDPKKTYQVYLRLEQKTGLIEKYGSLTKAIETLMHD